MHVFGWSLAEVSDLDIDELAYWTDEAERLFITLNTPPED